MLFPLLKAAMQNRFIAGLCQCRYTHADLVFIQLCSDQHQCTATLFLAKCCSHCSKLLCKTGSQQVCVSAVTPMEIWSSSSCAVTNTSALQHCFWQNAVPTTQCCCAKQVQSVSVLTVCFLVGSARLCCNVTGQGARGVEGGRVGSLPRLPSPQAP